MILFIITIIAMGICKAVSDKLQFHFGKSIFKDLDPLFWNPDISWKNKWALSNDGLYTKERFWGSSRWFVAFTDAWHLFQLIGHISFVSAILLYAPMTKWWYADFAIILTLHNTVFEIFFSKVFARS